MTPRNMRHFQAELADDVRRRQEALQRLGDHAASAHAQATAQAALGVVHELALVPETAGKALALLQELQVHQIELDAQIESSRHALAEADLSAHRRQAVHDRLPVACLGIDGSGRIQELNQTACAWLGTSRAWLVGERLAHVLSPADEAELQRRLTAVQQGLEPAPWALALCPDGQAARPVQAAIRADELPGRYLLVLMDRLP